MEELKKYEEPEMEIKFLDWSDIVTSSITPETVTPNHDQYHDYIDEDDPI